jgi:anti-sigma factor RsiW
MSSDHIEENLLEQYAMGVLAEQPRAALDEHLLGCPDCQSRLVQLDAFLAAFRPVVLQMKKHPVTGQKQFRSFSQLVWLSSAAALAACLLFLILKPGAQPAAPAIIQMQALRGPESAARLTAGQSAVLVFDVSGQAQPARYEIEVVDNSGKAVWTIETEAKGATLNVPLRALESGSYWVRVYRNQPEKRLFEEYALRVAEPSPVKR